MRHNEDAEQEIVFQWASYHKELRWMHSVPNGAFLGGDGSRRAMQMARLKAQGLRNGVSDIFLPRPTESSEGLSDTGYHGLYIEMKRRKVDGPSRVTKDQRDFQEYASEQGYKCVVCYGADEAITAIKEYLML